MDGYKTRGFSLSPDEKFITADVEDLNNEDNLLLYFLGYSDFLHYILL